jgi:BON domain-containing protein/cytidylate kinase-like protein
VRVKRMMDRLATDDRGAVENEIEMSEEAHTAITRRHFGVNWRDPENYDLVLSTERLSVDECVDEVEGLMRKGTFQETEESLRMVDDLALEWGVKAALRRDARTAIAAVTVQCAQGAVKLLGVVDTLADMAAAAEVAAAVGGVKHVDNQLRSTENAASRYRREG